METVKKRGRKPMNKNLDKLNETTVKEDKQRKTKTKKNDGDDKEQPITTQNTFLDNFVRTNHEMTSTISYNVENKHTATKESKEYKDMNANGQPSDPHLILHLHMYDSTKSMSQVPFPKESFEKSFFKYDPLINEPVAYEDNYVKSIPEECHFKKKTNESASIKNMFNKGIDESIKDMIDESSMLNIAENSIIKEAKHISSNINIMLLKDLINPSNWSNTTDYWCQWDCHMFNTQPIGLPVKYKNKKFHVVGCFCSLECATSYNFYGNETVYNSWENYNLINMLSNKINYKSNVNPALARKCLNVFGGPLDINTFRKKSLMNKQFNILQYPMVSLVEHIEEVNETIPYQKNMSYIPIDKIRIEKIEEANKDRVQGKKKSNLEDKMSLRFTG